MKVYKEPLIINGMFRSGTTLLWRVLSSDSKFNMYFGEPLHNLLKSEIKNHDHFFGIKIIRMQYQNGKRILG